MENDYSLVKKGRTQKHCGLCQTTIPKGESAYTVEYFNDEYTRTYFCLKCFPFVEKFEDMESFQGYLDYVDEGYETILNKLGKDEAVNWEAIAYSDVELAKQLLKSQSEGD